jgi:hypothetical protein
LIRFLGKAVQEYRRKHVGAPPRGRPQSGRHGGLPLPTAS